MSLIIIKNYHIKYLQTSYSGYQNVIKIDILKNYDLIKEIWFLFVNYVESKQREKKVMVKNYSF